MPRMHANGIELNFDLMGAGEPLVLVHGGWSDRNNWLPVIPGLARSFTVIALDRRGHGLSSHGVPGARRAQEDDLAAVIESVAGEPAHVVGTSFGGSIALGLAVRRPELVRSVVAHEPPLMSMVADDPEAASELARVLESITKVRDRVQSGDLRGAAEQFVEEIALGPGAWAQLPEPLRETMIDGAAAFEAEQQDPASADIDPDALARLHCPVLIGAGDESPAWFGPIVAALGAAMGHAEVHTFRGAGHAPHITHPDDYLAAVEDFLARVPARDELAAATH